MTRSSADRMAFMAGLRFGFRSAARRGAAIRGAKAVCSHALKSKPAVPGSTFHCRCIECSAEGLSLQQRPHETGGACGPPSHCWPAPTLAPDEAGIHKLRVPARPHRSTRRTAGRSSSRNADAQLVPAAPAIRRPAAHRPHASASCSAHSSCAKAGQALSGPAASVRKARQRIAPGAEVARSGRRAPEGYKYRRRKVGPHPAPACRLGNTAPSARGRQCPCIAAIGSEPFVQAQVRARPAKPWHLATLAGARTKAV